LHRGQVRSLQFGHEFLSFDVEQVCISGNQDWDFGKRSFGEDETIVGFVRRQKATKVKAIAECGRATVANGFQVEGLNPP